MRISKPIAAMAIVGVLFGVGLGGAAIASAANQFFDDSRDDGRGDHHPEVLDDYQPLPEHVEFEHWHERNCEHDLNPLHDPDTSR